MYVDENPPRLVVFGRVHEGSTTVHNVPLGNDQVKVGVDGEPLQECDPLRVGCSKDVGGGECHRLCCARQRAPRLVGGWRITTWRGWRLNSSSESPSNYFLCSKIFVSKFDFLKCVCGLIIVITIVVVIVLRKLRLVF